MADTYQNENTRSQLKRATGALVLNDRYKLIEKIGRGGMAEVWLAHDMTLERQVAVKIMLPEYANDPDFTRRFKMEAASAANLHSPYIVNVYDWGHDGEIQYIVMEYVRGSDLKSIIEERGPLTPRQAAKVGAQVCEALAAAHHQDIIHRDIKPQNIMIQPDGNIKVMDFGIARAKNSTEQKTQMVLGTAHYISPEQAQGKNLTAASDIYSLGIVLYEAVSGRVPFDAPDAVSVALKQVEEVPAPLIEVVPGIDKIFSDIVAIALEKQPNRRFASAIDMGHLLDDYAHNRKPTAAAATTQMMNTPSSARTVAMANQNAPQDRQRNMPANIPDEEEEEEKPNKKKIAIIVGICAAVIIAAIVAAVLLFGGGEKNITVPNVGDMTPEAATSLIEESGLLVGDIEEVPSADVEKGKIVKTDPKAGDKAPKGSKVKLYISTGVEQVKVPDLYNMTQEQALKALETVGLKGVEGPRAFSTDVKEGHIISQDPAGGMTVDAGTTITYVVSNGADSVTVPDLTGMTEQQAMDTLNGLGLKGLVGSRQASDTVEADHVISQNPAAGYKLEAGTQITFTISTGVAEVTVPSLTGLTQPAARSTLVNAGLTLGNVTSEYSDQTVDSVISQSVVYGTSVAKGTPIDIVLSKGPKPPENTNTNGNSNSNANNNNSNANNNGNENNANESE